MSTEKTQAFIKTEEGLNIYLSILHDLAKTNSNKERRKTITAHQNVAEKTLSVLLSLFETCSCLSDECSKTVLNMTSGFALKGMFLFYKEFPEFKHTDFIKLNENFESIKNKTHDEINTWKSINDKASTVLVKMEQQLNTAQQEDIEELHKLVISFDVMPEDEDIAKIAKDALTDAIELRKTIDAITLAGNRAELKVKSEQFDTLNKLSTCSGISMALELENDFEAKICATETAINFSLEALQQNLITAPDSNIMSHWISRFTDWLSNLIGIAGKNKLPQKQYEIFRRAVWIMPFGTIPLMSAQLGFCVLDAYRKLDKIQNIGKILVENNAEK